MLVDHVTVLLFLWHPNRGGLVITNALAIAGGETFKKKDEQRGQEKR